MKTVIISIKPKWVAKILNGEKTIEIRKTMPKCELPIDVYIYCTKEDMLTENGYSKYYIPYSKDVRYQLKKFDLSGKVVAKFTLNKVEEITQVWHISSFTNEKVIVCYRGLKNGITNRQLEKNSCLTHKELKNYIGWDKGYAWHIDNLETFDRPKELSEFIQTKRKNYEDPQVQKAPQSWCYVEV